MKWFFDFWVYNVWCEIFKNMYLNWYDDVIYNVWCFIKLSNITFLSNFKRDNCL